MKTPVTLIFFNRPETLTHVFDKVRLAKPEKLFLVQDGAREGNIADEKAIIECRKIVEQVDWPCEVKRDYSIHNMGCGMRPQTGITWVLSQTDRTIILEDDCIPDMAFFPYCEELLEKYKDDERIAYISGLNHFEKWKFGGSSYGFAKGGSIWGWATWRRAWNRYTYDCALINDPYIEACLRANYPQEKKRIILWKDTFNLVMKDEKISYWDVQWGLVKYTQSQLVIVPKYNLIRNIGVGATSTHASTNIEIHRRFKDFNNMPTYSLEFPIVHPKAVLSDNMYDEMLRKCVDSMRKKMLKKAAINRLLQLIRKPFSKTTK